MTRALAALLLLGSLVLILCSALHPILPLTPGGDLALITHTTHWHLIHLGLLYATGLIIAGTWAPWLAADGAERAGLGAAFVVLGIGEALNGVNIAYMTGAGTMLATLQQGGTDVQVMYQSGHAAAIMSGRLAGFLVALAAGMIAATTRHQAGEARWLVGVAAAACVLGLLGNFLAPPGHPLMLTSVGLMALWQLGTAIRLLRR